MAIRFTCVHCQKSLQAPDEFAGRQNACPMCGKVVTIPEPAPAAPIINIGAERSPASPAADPVLTQSGFTPAPIHVSPPAMDERRIAIATSAASSGHSEKRVITGIHLSFSNVFDLALKWMLATLIIGGVLWVILFVLLFIFSLFIGGMSEQPDMPRVPRFR